MDWSTQPNVLTVAEAVALLGCASSTVYRMIQRHNLEATGEGERLTVRTADLRAVVATVAR